MRLNSDVGESYGSWIMGNDEQVIPQIDMANIACGFHAGDPDTMMKTIELAVASNVQIGAHPSYDDKVGFGRRSIPYSDEQLFNAICYQVGALQALCKVKGTHVSYIKPHGAMYNDMMASEDKLRLICQCAAALNLPLMVLSTGHNRQTQAIAKQQNCTLMFEAFVDRAYTDDGYLVNRNESGAVLIDENEIQERISHLINGYVVTQSGNCLPLDIDSVCVHGDNPSAIVLIGKIKQWLSTT